MDKMLKSLHLLWLFLYWAAFHYITFSSIMRVHICDIITVELFEIYFAFFQYSIYYRCN